MNNTFMVLKLFTITKEVATGQILLGKQQPIGYTFKGMCTLNVLRGILADIMRVTLSGD
jgi:hypothetical protein